MAFKTFTAGSVLTAAEVNDYLMKQAVIVCTSATRPGAPVEGMTIYETDTDKLLIYTGATWQEALTVAAAWGTWTPALVQSGAVTSTVTRATYTREGRKITAPFRLAVTGSGTGANRVTVSLPVAAATATGNLPIGQGIIFDASANTSYGGVWVLISTTTAALVGDWSGPNEWGTLPNLALASGDGVSGLFVYEAAA